MKPSYLVLAMHMCGIIDVSLLIAGIRTISSKGKRFCCGTAAGRKSRQALVSLQPVESPRQMPDRAVQVQLTESLVSAMVHQLHNSFQMRKT